MRQLSTVSAFDRVAGCGHPVKDEQCCSRIAPINAVYIAHAVKLLGMCFAPSTKGGDIQLHPQMSQMSQISSNIPGVEEGGEFKKRGGFDLMKIGCQKPWPKQIDHKHKKKGFDAGFRQTRQSFPYENLRGKASQIPNQKDV